MVKKIQENGRFGKEFGAEHGREVEKYKQGADERYRELKKNLITQSKDVEKILAYRGVYRNRTISSRDIGINHLLGSFSYREEKARSQSIGSYSQTDGIIIETKDFKNCGTRRESLSDNTEEKRRIVSDKRLLSFKDRLTNRIKHYKEWFTEKYRAFIGRVRERKQSVK